MGGDTGVDLFVDVDFVLSDFSHLLFAFEKIEGE